MNVPIKSLISMHHLSDCVCRRTMAELFPMPCVQQFFHAAVWAQWVFRGIQQCPPLKPASQSSQNLISGNVRFSEEKKIINNASSKAWKSSQAGEYCTSGQLLSLAESLEPSHSHCLVTAPLGPFSAQVLGYFFGQFL